MSIYYDDWDFQVNARGELLDTEYNYQLELKYQEADAIAAEEERAAQHYSRGTNQHQNTGSRIGRDRIVTSTNQSQGRHPALNRNQQVNNYPTDNYPVAGGNRMKLGAASKKTLDIDLDNDEPEQNRNTRPPHSKAVPAVNQEVKNMHEIVKPVDHNYHEILLPAGFKQTKVYLPATELDENTLVVYYKREITNEIGDDDMNNKFGENYFNNDKGFIPVSIEKAEIVDLNKNDGSVVVLENGEDLVDQVLYLVPEDRIDNNKIYASDIFVAAKYYNNTGKNLFIELSTTPVTSPVDLMDKLEQYYNRYVNNEYTRNGILKIDASLANSLNTYLAAYCGRPGFFVKGFMLGVKPMYNKIRTDIKDDELRKNLLNAITTFLTNLMINIKEYVDGVPEETSPVDLFCPTRELMVISKNKNIAKELSEIAKEQPNEYLFKLIDRTYTPYLHDMVERLDKEKVIQKYNRLVFFTFDNMYSIIKGGSTGAYYISSFNRLVK